MDHTCKFRSPWLVVRALLPCTLLVLLITGCQADDSTPTHLQGTLHIAGSTALDPLVQAAISLFKTQYSAVTVTGDAIGSLNGLNELNSQQIPTGSTTPIQIGTSDVYADPARYPNPNLTDHIVAIVPFEMVVNPDVTVKSLTQQQIIDIYSTGKITNWSQVGGQNLPITPIVRPATSGTRATFRKYVLDGRDQQGTLTTSDVSATVRQAVAQTPGAIGYLAASTVDQTVTPIQINGYGDSAQNITSGNYSFWSYEHMYTIDDTQPITHAFLQFMLTCLVQSKALALGYLPISILLPQSSPCASGTADISGNTAGGH